MIQFGVKSRAEVVIFFKANSAGHEQTPRFVAINSLSTTDKNS